MSKPCSHDSRPIFDKLIDPLRDRAKELGYAIGVHGTLKRDIDLIACPWVDQAVPAPILAEELRVVAEKIHGYAAIRHEEADEFTISGCQGMKPHGRLVWSFHLGGGPYIDLSVMPRIQSMHLDLVSARAKAHELECKVASMSKPLSCGHPAGSDTHISSKSGNCGWCGQLNRLIDADRQIEELKKKLERADG